MVEMPGTCLCEACWLWCGLVGCQQSLILSEMWHVTILSDSSPRCQLSVWLFIDHFIAMFGIETALKNLGGVYDWLKKGVFKLWIYFYISTGWMRRAYQRSNVFYSFRSKPSFRQHPVNVIFFQLKRTLVRFSSRVFLFIHFAGE